MPIDIEGWGKNIIMSCCSSTDSTSTGGFESPRVLEGVLPEIESSVLPLGDELSFVGGKAQTPHFLPGVVAGRVEAVLGGAFWGLSPPQRSTPSP